MVDKDPMLAAVKRAAKKLDASRPTRALAVAADHIRIIFVGGKGTTRYVQRSATHGIIDKITRLSRGGIGGKGTARNVNGACTVNIEQAIAGHVTALDGDHTAV